MRGTGYADDVNGTPLRSVLRRLRLVVGCALLGAGIACGGEPPAAPTVVAPRRTVDELLDVYEAGLVLHLSMDVGDSETGSDPGDSTDRVVGAAADAFVDRLARSEAALAELISRPAEAAAGFVRRLERTRSERFRRHDLLRGLTRLSGPEADAAVERVSAWSLTDLEREYVFSTLAERRHLWALELALAEAPQPLVPPSGAGLLGDDLERRRSIWRLALGVLISWDHPAANAAVAAAVTAPSATDRADALRALGGPTFRGDVAALDVFVRALEDPVEAVAFAAEGRLDALVDERLAPVLERVAVTSDDAAFEAALAAAAAVRRRAWAPWLEANRARGPYA